MQGRLDQDLAERRAGRRPERQDHAVRLHRTAGARRQDERSAGSAFPPAAHQRAEMSSPAARGRSRNFSIALGFIVPPSGGFRQEPPEGGTTNAKYSGLLRSHDVTI